MEGVKEESATLKAQIDAIKVNSGASTSSGGNLAQGPTSISKFVYTARKMSKFDGQQSRLEDWVQEVKSTISNMGLTGSDASEFLVSHLEGGAKHEVRLLTKEERAEPQNVLDLLVNQFGERLTSSQIISKFHGRKHHKGDSL